MRKEADAKRLQAEFGDFFTPLLFDVTDEQAVNRAAAEVRSRMKGHYLMGLVNNAGDTLHSDDPVISTHSLTHCARFTHNFANRVKPSAIV